MRTRNPSFALALTLALAGTTASSGCSETVGASPADAATDRTPDAPLPDAPLPDAPLPDAPLPDAPLPDATTGLLAPLPSRCTARYVDVAPYCATAPCPVTSAVTLRCPSGGLGPHVAALPNGARVIITDNDTRFRPSLFTLDDAARTVAIEEMPTGDWIAFPNATGDGGWYAVVMSANASTREKVAIFTREAAGWRRTLLDGGPLDPSMPTPPLHRPDGREHFAWARAGTQNDGDIAVATRTPDGAWSVSTAVPGVPFGLHAIGTAAADGSGPLLVALWRFGVPDAGSRTLVLRDESSSRDVFVQRPGNVEDNNTLGIAARPGAASPVVSLSLGDGIHVFTPSGAGFHDTRVSDTARGEDPTCPGLGGDRCATMMRTCTARGIFGSSAAQRLLTARDGRVWLLFVRTIVNRDYEITARMMGPGCFDVPRVTADRSRYQVVVTEVVDDAVITRVIIPMPSEVIALDADVTGSTLALTAGLVPVADAMSSTTQYLRLDTTRLPR